MMLESITPDPALLFDLLALEQGQELLIIFDRFGMQIAHWIADAAASKRIDFTAQYVPMSFQERCAHIAQIPASLKTRVEQCRALVTAISDLAQCTRFRADLLSIAQKSGCRILHLPGVDWGMFRESLLGFNPVEIRTEAQRIKQILAGARTVEIFTRQPGKGPLHRLRISVDDRSLYLDTGMPGCGEIAQLPAGEVYLAPLEYRARGSVLINGSSPGRVIRNGDPAILHFMDGVVDLEGSSFANSVSGKAFKRELECWSSQSRDNLALGELGFGVNRAIQLLTGSPIHDEKAAGTLHIALGCNVPFGGTIACDNHADLILIPQAVCVDGREAPLTWGLGRNSSVK